MTGIYIHIPFCLQKCPYCDFYSIPLTDARAEAYTDAVIRAMRTHSYGKARADTLYFGGGTPILLGAELLNRILAAARDAFRLSADAEITLEANPAAAMKAELTALRQAGFNRVSFGVQSLVDSELQALGRPHDGATAKQAILAAAEAGFENISADLMLAIPGQTSESLARSIEGLTALPLSHISGYLLKIEEGTPFGDKKETLTLPDEDGTADLYFDCVYLLERQGFAQYEISNFARDGNVSRHNLIYWRCGEYLGFGPGAHSCYGGRRFYFPRDLDSFVAAEKPFKLTVADGAGGGFEEYAMLRLRLTEGLSLGQAPLRAPDAEAMLARARQLEQHGLVQVRDDNIALTTEGFLLSNPIIGALLAAIDPECSAAAGQFHP